MNTIHDRILQGLGLAVMVLCGLATLAAGGLVTWVAIMRLMERGAI